jgi:hypothetical protein
MLSTLKMCSEKSKLRTVMTFVEDKQELSEFWLTSDLNVSHWWFYTRQNIPNIGQHLYVSWFTIISNTNF